MVTRVTYIWRLIIQDDYLLIDNNADILSPGLELIGNNLVIPLAAWGIVNYYLYVICRLCESHPLIAGQDNRPIWSNKHQIDITKEWANINS